jgi:hypothetical protein
MKTLIALLTGAAILGLSAPRASADGGWSTAGKILTGVAIGGAVAQALQPPTVVYAAPPVVYSAPTVTYAPAPAPVVYSAPVYVQPAPAPVVVYAAPVYPRYAYPYPYYYGYGGPLVSVRFGFGGGHYYHRGRW